MSEIEQAVTPMMKQYRTIKSDYQDTILMFRMGDFYEMFGEDAVKASRAMEIALTARDGGNGIKIPMCGVPYHAVENYAGKLLSAGYKIAVCEQTEDPKVAKGIVKREVIRVLTPGTVIEAGYLKSDMHNYLASVSRAGDGFGLAAVDVSTGTFRATEVFSEKELIDELSSYNPSEIIFSLQDKNEKYVSDVVKTFPKTSFEYVPEKFFDYRFAVDTIARTVKNCGAGVFGSEDFPTASSAAGAVMEYVCLNQKGNPGNIFQLAYYRTDSKMILDYSTKKNLELFSGVYSGNSRNSLFGVIDHTVTASGKRLLADWLNNPLLDRKEITRRLDNTENLFRNINIQKDLKKSLKDVYDLERITARIAGGTANPKDLKALEKTLSRLPAIAGLLLSCGFFSEQEITEIDLLDDIEKKIASAIDENPPFTIREGGIIRNGFSGEIDELRQISTSGKTYLLELEGKEKEKSGIKNLKVGFNRVFGYYFEITRSSYHLVPENYIRKQTLANSERYITPELKELENKILSADEKLKAMEYGIYKDFLASLVQEIPRILAVSAFLAETDVFSSFAEVSFRNSYVRPEIVEKNVFELRNCRHPVVEKNVSDILFTPNDICMNGDDSRFLIITGPNMSGKSTYCRSAALAAVMMQIGCFVPADEAAMSVSDRVFARIGASDNLGTGQSTFMVEMSEAANILSNATEKSLIVLDEIGRGTSTYDGLAIAEAITTYIVRSLKAKTLFATHYHELIQLEKQEEGIRNYRVKVLEREGDIVFLHKIEKGGTDRSYGIHVAKLAGLPKDVICSAENILYEIGREQFLHSEAYEQQEAKNTGEESRCRTKIKEIKPDEITPREALAILYELKREVDSE